MSTVIRFDVNATATAAHVAPVLEPQGLRVKAHWNDRCEPAVYIGPADCRVGSTSGVYLAAGQQLVIGDDGRLRVEEVGRA